MTSIEATLDRLQDEAHEKVINTPKIVTALRNLADWCDEHRGLAEEISAGTFYIFADDPVKFGEALGQLGGLRRKSASDSYFNATRDFGAGIEVQVTISRNAACERVVVGIEHVEETITPAHDKEIIEWKCPPSLLGFGDGETA